MTFKSALVAFVLVSSLVTGAVAQSGTQSDQNACSRDASRYCRKEMANGDSAVQQCLIQNRSKLGAACSKVFQSHGM